MNGNCKPQLAAVTLRSPFMLGTSIVLTDLSGGSRASSMSMSNEGGPKAVMPLSTR